MRFPKPKDDKILLVFNVEQLMMEAIDDAERIAHAKTHYYEWVATPTGGHDRRYLMSHEFLNLPFFAI